MTLNVVEDGVAELCDDTASTENTEDDEDEAEEAIEYVYGWLSAIVCGEPVAGVPLSVELAMNLIQVVKLMKDRTNKLDTDLVS